MKNKGGLILVFKSVFLIILEEYKLFLFLHLTNNHKCFCVPQLNVKHDISTLLLDINIFQQLNCNNITLFDQPHKLKLITLIIKIKKLN